MHGLRSRPLVETQVYRGMCADLPRSEYRTKRWPLCPPTHIDARWSELNRFRSQKFAHHVSVPIAFEQEAVSWCEDQFGEQAVGNSGTGHPRYWTRGVWTWIRNHEDNTARLMFIERGFAMLARIRWG